MSHEIIRIPMNQSGFNGGHFTSTRGNPPSTGGIFAAKLMSLRNRGSPSKRLFQEIELGEVL